MAILPAQGGRMVLDQSGTCCWTDDEKAGEFNSSPLKEDVYFYSSSVAFGVSFSSNLIKSVEAFSECKTSICFTFTRLSALFPPPSFFPLPALILFFLPEFRHQGRSRQRRLPATEFI